MPAETPKEKMREEYIDVTCSCTGVSPRTLIARRMSLPVSGRDSEEAEETRR